MSIERIIILVNLLNNHFFLFFFSKLKIYHLNQICPGILQVIDPFTDHLKQKRIRISVERISFLSIFLTITFFYFSFKNFKVYHLNQICPGILQVIDPFYRSFKKIEMNSNINRTNIILVNLLNIYFFPFSPFFLKKFKTNHLNHICSSIRTGFSLLIDHFNQCNQ